MSYFATAARLGPISGCPQPAVQPVVTVSAPSPCATNTIAPSSIKPCNKVQEVTVSNTSLVTVPTATPYPIYPSGGACGRSAYAAPAVGVGRFLSSSIQGTPLLGNGVLAAVPTTISQCIGDYPSNSQVTLQILNQPIPGIQITSGVYDPIVSNTFANNGLTSATVSNVQASNSTPPWFGHWMNICNVFDISGNAQLAFSSANPPAGANPFPSPQVVINTPTACRILSVAGVAVANIIKFTGAPFISPVDSTFNVISLPVLYGTNFTNNQGGAGTITLVILAPNGLFNGAAPANVSTYGINIEFALKYTI